MAHGLENEEVKKITPYLNRISDYLFVLARLVNFKLDYKETIWKV
jgi:cob(I)alamin adenosyltransferase